MLIFENETTNKKKKMFPLPLPLLLMWPAGIFSYFFYFFDWLIVSVGLRMFIKTNIFLVVG